MIGKVTKAWNDFFFKPTSPSSLGLYRIFFGIIVLDSLIGKFIDRGFLYGQNGIISLETLKLFFPGAGERFNIYHLVPAGDPELKWFFFVLMGFTLLFIFGFCTRLNAVLMFLGILALSNRNPAAENAGDDLIRINCFFLMFSQAGAAYSMDRRLLVKRGLAGKPLPLVSSWPLRLLQLQLAYVYLDTVYLKLHGPAWRDGTALYYALNYLEFKRFEFKALFYYLWQIKLATWSTLLIETSMFTLVWIRKFRYWCLAAAFFLHWGLNLVMQFPIFQYVMISSLVLFIFPEDIERIQRKISK